MRAFFMLLLGLGLLISCKNQTGTSVVSPEKHESDSLPHSFLDFYDRFHEDGEYQLEHILFPLESKVFESKDIYYERFWDRENWKTHQALDKNQAGFERKYTLLDDFFISEILTLKAGGFGIERRFAYMDTTWYLVLYNEYYINSGTKD
jgi:hypothetical protein